MYFAGLLRNAPEDMIFWHRHRQRIVPGNVMPNMGFSEQQARDVAACRYTLR